jgi:hypothetical protein
LGSSVDRLFGCLRFRLELVSSLFSVTDNHDDTAIKPVQIVRRRTRLTRRAFEKVEVWFG